MLVANKITLLDSLLRVIAASFGDLPHSFETYSKVGDRRTTSNERVGRFNHRLRLLTAVKRDNRRQGA